MNSENINEYQEADSTAKKIVLFGVLSFLLTGAITGLPAVLMGHSELKKHKKNLKIYSDADRRIIIGGIFCGYIGIILLSTRNLFWMARRQEWIKSAVSRYADTALKDP